MKKIIAMIICLLLLLTICSACTNVEPEQVSVTPQSTQDTQSTQIVTTPEKHSDTIELAVFLPCNDSDIMMQSVYGVVNEAQKNGANVSVFIEDSNEVFVKQINDWLEKNKDIKKGFIAVNSEEVLKYFYDELKKEDVKMGIIYSQSYQIEPQPSEMYYDYLQDNGFTVDFKSYLDIFDVTDAETNYLKEKYDGKSGSILASIKGAFQYNIIGKQKYRVEIWESAMKERFGSNGNLSSIAFPQVSTEEDALEDIDFYFPPNNNVVALIAKDEVLIQAAKESKNITGDIYFEGVCNDEVLSFIEDGSISALFELPNYDMGEKSTDAIIDIINGKKVDYLIKSDMNILTKDTVTERIAQIEKAKKYLKKLNFDF